jgi:hypothetical protein
MTLIRCILLLQFAMTFAPSKLAQSTKQSNVTKQPEATVQSLYREVVARHPVGIPESSDMKILSPYLSKALLHKIDLAVACSNDWGRQHPDPNEKPEIAWLESGLFSGDDERTSPHAFQIEKVVQENDGTFRAYVRLTWGAEANPWIWHVAVIVVEENSHFVVDDVIYLKDKDRDDESSLSKYLSSGCEGPRWVGSGERRNDANRQK